jgi:hypothetical protein
VITTEGPNYRSISEPERIKTPSFPYIDCEAGVLLRGSQVAATKTTTNTKNILRLDLAFVMSRYCQHGEF